MKKKILTLLGCVVLFIAIFLIVTGYTVETSAYITDEFSLSEDGSKITFHTGVGSSMGYVRGYKDEGGGVKPHYLKFYSAWGGLNSSLGAKDEYTLPIDENDTEIYVYHGDGGYDLALQKDSVSGEWHRVR